MISEEDLKIINDIRAFCIKHNILKYVFNNDLSIDITGDTWIEHDENYVLGIKINKLNGSLTVVGCNYINLYNFPSEVSGSVYINNMFKLTSLEHSPKIIKGSFISNKTSIKSLHSNIQEVQGDFTINDSLITNLHGIPTRVDGIMDFSDNKNLISFNTKGIICNNSGGFLVAGTPLAALLFKKKVPYFYKFNAVSLYRIPCILLKYNEYCTTSDGEIDLEMYSNIMEEVKEGML